jgi:glucosylceramidase
MLRLILNPILIFAISLAVLSTRSTVQTVSQPTLSCVSYVTAKGTNLRLSKTGECGLEPFSQPTERQPFILVDESVKFQTFIGIGGAVTDASAETFGKLPENRREELLKAYFSNTNGISYNAVRVNIAACDFSSSSYDYIEPGDSLLKSFSIAHDEKFRIPLLNAIKKDYVNNLLVFASPWSPPAWMKSNKSVLHGGSLLPVYRKAWADHFVKFIDEYSRRGLYVWAVSPQNEPMAIQRWESCIYSADEESEFIGRYLGPALENSKYKSTKIIAWDHNRDLIFQRASSIMRNKAAAKYVWGFGYHWYETWTGGDMQFSNVKLVKESFPSKELVFTEGCVEKFNADSLGSWRLGERYGHSMVNDFNCGTSAWFDWNILLDEKGGPNHVGNLCYAPVHANTSTGELTYTSSFYYIGHFSKFIRPGARRVAVSSNRYDLETTGFINPNGDIVVIVLNGSESKIDFKLCDKNMAAGLSSLPHSIMTLVINH